MASFNLPDQRGLLSINRTAVDVANIWHNKIKIGGDYATPSTALYNGNDFLMTRNSSGSPGTYSSCQFALAWWGRGMSQHDIEVITDAFEAYMDANGKGVIA